ALWQAARLVAGALAGAGADPVHAEGAPILAGDVPGDQVPPLPGVDQLVGLHQATDVLPVGAFVVERDLAAGGDRGRKVGQVPRVDGVARDAQSGHRGFQRVV